MGGKAAVLRWVLAAGLLAFFDGCWAGVSHGGREAIISEPLEVGDEIMAVRVAVGEG